MSFVITNMSHVLDLAIETTDPDLIPVFSYRMNGWSLNGTIWWSSKELAFFNETSKDLPGYAIGPWSTDHYAKLFRDFPADMSMRRVPIQVMRDYLHTAAEDKATAQDHPFLS